MLSERESHRRQSFCWDIPLFWLLLSVLLLVAACVPPAAQPTQATSTPPVSPLIPGSNRTLAENRWRLVEIQFHGEDVKFDSLAPVYFTFWGDGHLGYRTTDCNATSFTIVTENERHYRLTPNISTAMSCSEIQYSQSSGIHRAVMATTEYEMEGNQLVLFGDGVRITLEIDNPK
ncbi:MAG: META domain-containing protein [Chloroflexi bacterium]|nr:META domain-containing protein [Chloroflexota bacterium]